MLAPSSRLVCYTDGVSECHDGRQFFDEEGIAEVLGRPAKTVAEAAAAIEAAARACGPRQGVKDDMAILAVEVL